MLLCFIYFDGAEIKDTTTTYHCWGVRFGIPPWTISFYAGGYDYFYWKEHVSPFPSISHIALHRTILITTCDCILYNRYHSA